MKCETKVKLYSPVPRKNNCGCNRTEPVTPHPTHRHRMLEKKKLTPSNILILFTEVTISHSDIIPNQKCNFLTFHADTRKVIGRSKLLPTLCNACTDYELLDQTSQKFPALLSPRKMNRNGVKYPYVLYNARCSTQKRFYAS